MKNPEIKNDDSGHQTIGHREGDYIIFTCPTCRDYERRINWKTGKVSVKKGKENIPHFGSHAPVSVDTKNLNQN